MNEIVISKIYLFLLSTLVSYETFKYIIKLTVKQDKVLKLVVFSILPLRPHISKGGETFSRGGFVSRPTKTNYDERFYFTTETGTFPIFRKMTHPITVGLVLIFQ